MTHNGSLNSKHRPKAYFMFMNSILQKRLYVKQCGSYLSFRNWGMRIFYIILLFFVSLTLFRYSRQVNVLNAKCYVTAPSERFFSTLKIWLVETKFGCWKDRFIRKRSSFEPCEDILSSFHKQSHLTSEEDTLAKWFTKSLTLSLFAHE